MEIEIRMGKNNILPYPKGQKEYMAFIKLRGVAFLMCSAVCMGLTERLIPTPQSLSQVLEDKIIVPHL